jgi:putative DNA primase/helicase
LALTDETRFQKGLIIFGVARSGKGTIARVLKRLLGAKNCCGPSLAQLTKDFGMEGLIGKKLAVVPDARLDQRSNRSVITEKILSIIGEDVLDINRKNKVYWTGILRSRMMILSNELPDFKDDTGVIATRFIILETVVSFLGREDIELEDKLCGELSGILNWAVEGWGRLVERGKFEAPDGGELNEELAGIASAVKAFGVDRCEFAPSYSELVGRVFERYVNWLRVTENDSWESRLPRNQFSNKFKAAFPGVGVVRPRSDDPKRPRMFVGVRLKRK